MCGVYMCACTSSARPGGSLPLGDKARLRPPHPDPERTSLPLGMNTRGDSDACEGAGAIVKVNDVRHLTGKADLSYNVVVNFLDAGRRTLLHVGNQSHAPCRMCMCVCVHDCTGVWMYICKVLCCPCATTLLPHPTWRVPTKCGHDILFGRTPKHLRGDGQAGRGGMVTTFLCVQFSFENRNKST